MSDEKNPSDEFESLLRSEAPVLLRMLSHPQALSPGELASIKKQLEEIHPFLRILTSAQMRQVILQLCKARSMDVMELASLLRKNNVKLLDATGDAELLGLLRELENAKRIEGEWKDSGSSRKKVYKLTDLGRKEISQVTSKETELAHWLLSRTSA